MILNRALRERKGLKKEGHWGEEHSKPGGGGVAGCCWGAKAQEATVRVLAFMQRETGSHGRGLSRGGTGWRPCEVIYYHDPGETISC